MKALVTAFISFFSVSCLDIAAAADDFSARAWQMESKGEAAEARDYLRRAAQDGGVDAKLAYAEFLDRHRDPAARDAYEKAWDGARGEQREFAARRLVLLDLMAGDRDRAQHHLEDYRAAGGRDFAFPQGAALNPEKRQTITIPGPLRSFSRMAALAPEMSPEDVLTALARNVVTNGYQAAGTNALLEQTEYLKLVIRYLSQARELEKLADSSGAIKIETCDSSQTGELLRVLGYRMRGGCGSEVVLETLNASRAFLTIDSGFPLAELEQDLRTNPLYTGLLAIVERPPGPRVHRCLPRRPLAVPLVSRTFEARASRFRGAAQGHHGSKDSRLCACARFLRRDVPGSQRPGSGTGRRPFRESLG
jgi:hypothetical protein